MNKVNHKIKDAGALIPHAKKHLAKNRKKSDAKPSNERQTLRKVWPQPDWIQLLESGVELNALVYMAVLYNSFRSSPRYKFACVDHAMWSDAFYEGIEVMRKLFDSVRTFDEAKAIKDGYHKHFGIVKSDFKNNNLINTYPAYALGSGESRTIYTNFCLSSKQHELVQWLEELDWPYNKSAIKANLFPVKLQSGRWALGKPNKRSWTFGNDDIYETKEACLDAFRKLYIKVREKTWNPCKAPFELTQIQVAKKNVTGDDIINDFGFRGVQFGRSMGDAERQLWLDQIYHALDVYADVIGIPNKKWLGLGGLGIAFGARGSGTAMAHYEPRLGVVALTRKSGPGSLAHEHLHALDHHLRKKLKSPHNFKFATQVLQNLSHSTLIKQHKIPRHYLVLKKFFQLGRYENDKHRFVSQARKLSAQHRGRKYWASTVELYARCYEAYIEDKLAKLGIHCPWLVSGTLESDYPAEYSHKHPYPIGAERLEFYQLWEEFFTALFRKS